jgi:hypothetical protein
MPRKNRRTRIRGGMTQAERWALSLGYQLGMPGGEAWPFADEADAKACWRKNRAVLMAEMYPGHPPDGLWAHEPEAFVSLESIRNLRLDARSLNHISNEIDGEARAARRNGRPELAYEFEQRSKRVRAVLAEGAV